MPNSDRTELRLTLLNIAVFAAVLATFSFCVYAIFVDKLEEDTRSDLRHLADAVIASIDFDEDKSRNPGSAEPDLIASDMPASSAKLLNALKLQWFDYQGQFKLEKGTFPLNLPLVRKENFIQQANPRGIVFTKVAMADGVLLGYVRVAQPLDKQDRAIENLRIGLMLGTLAALFVSGAGMAILVPQSIAPLRRTMKQLRQFSSDASHELRTPLMAICTNSKVALKYPEGMRDGDLEKFEAIQQSSLRMQRLVEDLLLLSQAERASNLAKPKSVGKPKSEAKSKNDLANPCTVARLVIGELSWLSERQQITIENETEENSSADLIADISADHLGRVISNLLENALRYSPPGSSVKIWQENSGNSVTIFVQDNGPGINAVDQKRIFDRFWRADKARAHDQQAGQGLGLAIAKELVESCGGSIAVKSSGAGTCFSIKLPLA
ncbi:HAMP domain-containing sensor histidine kinase [soil metagenome]